MANKLEIFVSAVTDAAERGLRSFGASIKSLGAEAKGLLENKLLQGLGFGAMLAGLQKAWGAADALSASLRALGAAAKLTGTPLEALQAIAKDGQERFGLSAVQANQYAVELAKLAGKAGDVGKAGPGLEAFLDIGAARGLTAADTLTAVKQSILGIDEGTDKLFNKNPSVLYAEFASSIGTTAGKLTDQQKAQALLNAAMQDGGKVQGEYQAWLKSNAGLQAKASNELNTALVELGNATQGLRRIGLEALSGLATGARNFIGGIQLLAVDLSIGWMSLGPKAKRMAGEVLLALSGLIGGARPLLMLFGKGVEDIADSMGDMGVKMVREASVSLRNLKVAQEEGYAEIIGSGHKALTNAAVQAGIITTTSGASLGKITTATKEAMAASQTAIKLGLDGLVAHVKDSAAPRLIEATGGLESAIKKIGDGWVYVDGKWQAAESGLEDAGESLEDLAFKARDAADFVLNLADSLGLADEKTTSLLSGIGDLAEGIGRLASGDIAGGILKGIGGIKSALSGLFGKSEAEKKLAASLDKNRNRLEELTAEIGDLNLNLTGKQLSGTQGALTEFFATGGANAKGWGDRLGNLLLKRGVNMSDLEEVAKTLGIDLRPNGKLDPRMLQQLLAAIGAVEPTQFRNDYRGKRDRLAAETNISNLSPAEQAQRLAAIGAGETTGTASSRLGTLDLSSATGRNTGLATIQSLLGRMLSGSMSTAELGGLTGSEFLSLLEDLKGLIESANQDAEAAADKAASDAKAAADLQTKIGEEQQKILEAQATVAGIRAEMQAVANAQSVVDRLKADPTSSAAAIGNAQATLDALKEAAPSQNDLNDAIRALADEQAKLNSLLESAGVEASPTGPGVTPNLPPIASLVTAALPVLTDLGPVTSGLDLLGQIEVNTGAMRDLLMEWASPAEAGGGATAGFGGVSVTIENLIINEAELSAVDQNVGLDARVRIYSVELRRQLQEELKVRGVALLS